METKDIITLAGIVASFLIGLWGLILGLKNNKKAIFINSITSSRIKWIDTIRNTIAEFCGLTYHYCLTRHELGEKEKNDLREKVDRLRFLIKLQLNRNDPFDQKIISKIDLIPGFTDKDEERLNLEIDELIHLTQDLLKLEWEGVKKEALKGNLRKRQKKDLYEKFLNIEKDN